VGAGQQSTHGTINEIPAGATAGAQAVLVITPHYLSFGDYPGCLGETLHSIADSSSVPVILYSMPDSSLALRSSRRLPRA